jgi:tetratricopeptide (TPR) repeat protein
MQHGHETEVTAKIVEKLPYEPAVHRYHGEAWMNEALRWGPHKVMKWRVKNAQEAFALADRLGGVDPLALSRLAVCHERRGENAEAIAAGRRAIRSGARGWEVYYALAQALAGMQRYEEADLAFQAAAARLPKEAYAIAWENGRALMRGGLYARAHTVFADLVASSTPTYPQSMLWLGMAALARGEYRAALMALGRSHQIEGDDYKPVSEPYWVGRVYYAAGMDDLAEIYFRDGIERATYMDSVTAYRVRRGFLKAPEAPAVWHHYLGRALWSAKKPPEASEQFKLALGRRPNDLTFARWLFALQLNRGKLNDAAKLCYELGERGKWREAVEGLKRVVDLATHRARLAGPFGARPWIRVARDALEKAAKLAYNWRRYELAVHYYSKLGLYRGTFASTWAGWSALLSNRLDVADRCFRSVLRQFPKGDFTRLGLAWTRLRLKDYKTAAAHFGAIKDKGRKWNIQCGLFWSHLLAGDRGAARKHLNAYALLGAAHQHFSGGGTGFTVHVVVPGSPAEAAGLVHGDRITWIGDVRVGNDEKLQEFIAAGIPNKPVAIYVRRGGTKFRIDVDFKKVQSKWKLTADTNEESGHGP